MNEARPWHRLFGLSWFDFFHGLPVSVELEKDLSLKQQLLDMVLIRKEAGPLPCRLPDGFEDLAPHNLVSFKSFQEALDGGVLNELVGHFVNYRKQVSPSMQDLLPETDFRLFAVTVRFPQTLTRQTTLTGIRPGVYEVRHFTGIIRVIVVHELPQQDHNAMLHLFSARKDLVEYGRTHYEPRSEETSTLLRQLFLKFRPEALLMPKLLDQDDLFQRMTPGEVLKELVRETRDEVIKDMPPEELIKRYPAEKFLKGLSPDELLAALSPEMRAALAQRLKDDPDQPKAEPPQPRPGDPKP